MATARRCKKPCAGSDIASVRGEISDALKASGRKAGHLNNPRYYNNSGCESIVEYENTCKTARDYGAKARFPKTNSFDSRCQVNLRGLSFFRSSSTPLGRLYLQDTHKHPIYLKSQSKVIESLTFCFCSAIFVRIHLLVGIHVHKLYSIRFIFDLLSPLRSCR